MRKKLLLSVLISTSIIFAQKKQLTLNEAIQIAFEKNSQIVIAKNNLNISKGSRLAAIGGLIPTLSTSTGINETNSDSPIQNTILGQIGGKDYTKNNSVGVTARVTLFDGFANYADINKANSNIASSEFSLKRIFQQIQFETKRRYLQVLRNASLLEVSQENLKRSQKQLQRITEINKVGAASKADVYRQQVATSNDELSVIRAENNFENSKADLFFFIALSPDKNLELVKPEFNLHEAKNQKLKSIGELISNALQVRPDYLASLANEQTSESELTIAKAGHYPTISASAGYTLSDKKFNTINDNKTSNWGLTLSLPLFTGFATDYAIELQNYRLLNTKEQTEQIKREIQVDVQKAILDFESTKKELDVTEKNITSAKEDLQIADERYKLGASTLLDLLVANTNYVKAQSDKINAEFNFQIVQEELNFAIGENYK